MFPKDFIPTKEKTNTLSITYQVFKCQVKILENIVNIDLSLNSLIVIILKCRMYRGVTGFRPPPKYQKGQSLTMLLVYNRVFSYITEYFLYTLQHKTVWKMDKFMAQREKKSIIWIKLILKQFFPQPQSIVF